MTNTIKPVLIEKIPEFARELYPRFVTFMRDWLDFLEQDGNFLNIINNWNHNNDVSNMVEPYIDAMLRDLGFESGQNLSINKHMLVHILRDFYLSRGSEASFKVLFRILFNEAVSIQYPREQLLIASHADYGERHFIFSTAANRDSIDYNKVIEYIIENGGVLEGVSSEVTASIEEISVVHGSGVPYLRIEILRPTNEFIIGEPVVIRGGDDFITESVKPVLSIEVLSPGFGYSEGDTIHVQGPNLQGQAKIASVTKGGVTSLTFESNSVPAPLIGKLLKAQSADNGFGFSAKIKSASSGGVVYEIINRGYNYTKIPAITSDGSFEITGESTEIGSIQRIQTDTPYVDFESCVFDIISDTGTGAVFAAKKVSRWSTSSWANNRGFIGENSTLIDSDKYQQYSYTIVSAISADQYNSFVNDLLHPAGYVKTSSYEIVSNLSLSLNASDIEFSETVEYSYDNQFALAFDSELETDTFVMMVTDGMNEIVTTTPSNIIVSP